VYKYLLENLISYSQVDGNLRRTADRGLVSELYRKQMNALALKYFGVDSHGNYTENIEEIVSYRCPYSGELIKDLSNAHLEHILPVSSNGGTVLFNCIPILDKVNLSKSDEPNLLTWWQKQDYFSYDRLERLVQYMLEAYNLSFKEPTNEEELYDYENSSNEDYYIENDDLSIDLRSKSNIITSSNQNITYYQLLTDLINELSKNRDVSQYNYELNNLKEQNIFGNIKEIEKVIKSVQNVFKELLGDNSKKYLSYSLKIDMNKLLKSFKSNNYEQELRERIEYIKLLIIENNVSINDYLENLQDIDDINLIYFDINTITKEQKNNFIENIKIGYNTKILIFIEMIKRAKSKEEIAEIFKVGTTKCFTTYKQNENGEWVEDKTYGEIGSFWNDNKDKINSILEEMMNNDIELRDKLDDYYMNTLSGQHSEEGNRRRINIFIDMIIRAKSKEDIAEIFTQGTTKCFTAYKQNENGEWVEDKMYGEINQFWRRHKDKINSIFEEMMNNNIELRDKLDDYYMNTLSGQQSEEGNRRRINIFIDMIIRAKSKEEIAEIFKVGTTKCFTTYKQNENGEWVEDKTYGEIGSFWNNNKDKINSILEETMNNDIELRDKLDDYYMNTLSGQNSEEGNRRRINIFIDMIKKTKSKEDIAEIFKFGTTKCFTTYKQNENGEWVEDKIYGEINQFQSSNKDKINSILEEMMNNDIELRDKLDDYYMNTLSGQHSEEGNRRRINIFIDMIIRAKSKEDIAEIFIFGTTKYFTTYKQNENGEWGEDKTYGEIGHFWSHHKDKINSILEEMMNNDIGLRDKLDDYYMNTLSGQQSKEGKRRRINIFIDMIKRAKSKEEIAEIFTQKTTKCFTTYKQNENGEWVEDKMYGEINKFWQNNKNKKIIPELFYSEDYASKEYDVARENVINYLNSQRRMKKKPEFRTIDEYVDTLDKTKKENKVLIELRNSLLLKKEQLIIQNQELNQELNTSIRRAI